ncbi:MAG: hypothetical protein M0Z69_00390, partial [Actinomycetota bacterium]|nr:hypothetical protein [Actinomycetota bacterium]
MPAWLSGAPRPAPAPSPYSPPASAPKPAPRGPVVAGLVRRGLLVEDPAQVGSPHGRRYRATDPRLAGLHVYEDAGEDDPFVVAILA